MPAPASPLSFDLTPMNVEASALPGTDQTGVITVEQPAAGADGQPFIEPIRLRVHACDWTLGRTGNLQLLGEGTRPNSCTRWLRVNPSEVDVPPGKSCPVRYTLHIPADAQGSYHTVLLFETVPEPMQGRQSSMQVRGRIGCVLYVQVGPQVRRVRVTDFAVTPRQMTLTLRNTGNTQVRLKGVCRFVKIQINGTDTVVRQVSMPSVVILPGDDDLRDLALDMPTLQSGDYQATVLLDYGGDALVGARTRVHVP